MIAAEPSSARLTAWKLATGASLTAVTVISTVAGAEFDQAVVGGEGERVAAVEIGVRGVAQVRGCPAQAAVGRGADHAEGQRVAVRVGAAQGDRQGGVFSRGDCLGIGDRLVVGAGDRDRNQGGGRAGLAVAGCEGEAVVADVARFGGIGQVRGCPAQGAMGRALPAR